MADFNVIVTSYLSSPLPIEGVITRSSGGQYYFSAVSAQRTDIDEVTVYFSDAVDFSHTSVLVAGNYAISGPSPVSVSSVAPGMDSKSVTFATNGTWIQGTYTVSIASNVAHATFGYGSNVSNEYTTLDVFVFEVENLGAPIITQMEPTPGTAIGRYQPVSFIITDPDGIRACFVWASYEALGLDEVVYDGVQFTTKYSGTMVASETELSFYEVLRKGGWPVAGWKIRAPSLHIAAIDTLGAENV